MAICAPSEGMGISEDHTLQVTWCLWCIKTKISYPVAFAMTGLKADIVTNIASSVLIVPLPWPGQVFT